MQTTLQDDDPLLYERGALVSHSTDECGMPDMGLSVGLGDGQMLYAGEGVGDEGDVLILYSQTERHVIAVVIDRHAAFDLIGIVAGALTEGAR